jgi:hypothetical protein
VADAATLSSNRIGRFIWRRSPRRPISPSRSWRNGPPPPARRPIPPRFRVGSSALAIASRPMAHAVRKRVYREQYASTYPALEVFPPGQDGDTRAPVPRAVRLLNCLVVTLSQIPWVARRFECDRPSLSAALGIPAAANRCPRLSADQATRAGLLAKAVTATLRWALIIKRAFAHGQSGVSRSAT